MNTEYEINFSGQSMMPFISPGDALLVEKNISDPQVGDVILLHDGNELLAHRICEIKGNKVTTKGDRSCNIEVLKRDEIVARVTQIKKESGNIVKLKDQKRLMRFMAYISSKYTWDKKRVLRGFWGRVVRLLNLFVTKSSR